MQYHIYHLGRSLSEIHNEAAALCAMHSYLSVPCCGPRYQVPGTRYRSHSIFEGATENKIFQCPAVRGPRYAHTCTSTSTMYHRESISAGLLEQNNPVPRAVRSGTVPGTVGQSISAWLLTDMHVRGSPNAAGPVHTAHCTPLKESFHKRISLIFPYSLLYYHYYR